MRSSSLLTVRQIADRCDVPVGWIKDEAEAGRLPCLRFGRRFFFNLKAVRRALVRRAMESGGPRHG